jgi:hypothetical protein
MESLMDSKPPENQPPGDYAVGYGRPPKTHQFKKGEPPPPRGTPKPQVFDLLAILNKPVEIARAGKTRVVPAYEQGLLAIARGALKGDVAKIKYLFKEFEKHGIFEKQKHDPMIRCPDDLHEGVFRILAGHLYRNAPYSKPELRWAARQYLATRSLDNKEDDEIAGCEQELKELAS